MRAQEQDRVLLAMALVVDEATSLSLDSAEDRRELKRRLGAAVVQAAFRVPMLNTQHPNHFAKARCGGNMNAPCENHHWITVGSNRVCSHCDVLLSSGWRPDLVKSVCPFCNVGVLQVSDGVESCDECGASAPCDVGK